MSDLLAFLFQDLRVSLQGHGLNLGNFISFQKKIELLLLPCLWASKRNQE